LASAAALDRAPAFRMAGTTLRDVAVVELYDCYTFTVIVTLEDYGFCPKGEGGRFGAEQVTGPGGHLAVNTGGGQLASFYMWGITPVSEAVIQLRGDGEARQVPGHDVALVSGNGGVLSTHSTLVLSRLPACAPSRSRCPRSRPGWPPSGRPPAATSWWCSAAGAAARIAFRRARSAAAVCRATPAGSASPAAGRSSASRSCIRSTTRASPTRCPTPSSS